MCCKLKVSARLSTLYKLCPDFNPFTTGVAYMAISVNFSTVYNDMLVAKGLNSSMLSWVWCKVFEIIVKN